ncbi:hypothetical protein ABT247_18645, partial [Kitasatospora sp. NPDC001539]|uniref:hypothetical protein n=1 Tax=Kitasatospora sp. NPDC001539 TaxID=3154384 RepID=UPI0033324538
TQDVQLAPQARPAPQLATTTTSNTNRHPARHNLKSPALGLAPDERAATAAPASRSACLPDPVGRRDASAMSVRLPT